MAFATSHSGFQVVQDRVEGLFLLVSSGHVAEHQLAAGDFFRTNDYRVGNGFLICIVELFFQLYFVRVDLGADPGISQARQYFESLTQ
jgi:hypothetical protein